MNMIVETIAIKCGDVVKEACHESVIRLPLLRDILMDVGAENGLIDLGRPDIPIEWMHNAMEWINTPPDEYVLPRDYVEAEQVRTALRYFGVDEGIVESLMTVEKLINRSKRLDLMKMMMLEWVEQNARHMCAISGRQAIHRVAAYNYYGIVCMLHASGATDAETSAIKDYVTTHQH